MKKCDIIIPIYNAYDYIERCVESVIRNTDFNKARLILIDDESPDERVWPLLEELAEKHSDKIVLLKNEKNLGFVGTVNRGMKYSREDVLLLNSDTEVTSGWLEKMQSCAYKDERIATVTPLSNNATLASVPYFNQPNGIPRGYSLEEMGKIVEKCSLKIYPEIPSGCGFCLYIKRAALKKIGYFDEKSFGKGYGEENDFCFRCLNKGYRHILCDKAYVYHERTQSFLDKKVLHGDMLRKKHPEIMERTSIWYRKQEIRIIGDNIALAVGTGRNRKNVLIITEGSEITEDWMKKVQVLRGENNVWVLMIKESCCELKAFFEDIEVVVGGYVKPMSVVVEKSNEKYEEILQSVIADCGIGLVWAGDAAYNDSNKKICKDNKIAYIKGGVDVKKIIKKIEKCDPVKVNYLKLKEKLKQYDEMRIMF